MRICISELRRRILNSYKEEIPFGHFDGLIAEYLFEENYKDTSGNNNNLNVNPDNGYGFSFVNTNQKI